MTNDESMDVGWNSVAAGKHLLARGRYRAHEAEGHYQQHQHGKDRPVPRDLALVGRGLVGKDAHRARWCAWQVERLPDGGASRVLAERPGGLLIRALGREQQRRGDVVAHAGHVERPHAPRKLSQDVVGGRRRRLEQLERPAVVARRRPSARRRLRRQDPQRRDVVPVALILAEVPEALLAVVEQVLVPAVLLVVDDDVAVLVADDFKRVAAQACRGCQAGSSARIARAPAPPAGSGRWDRSGPESRRSWCTPPTW